MLEDTATTEEDQSTEEVEIEILQFKYTLMICLVNGLCLMLNPDMKKK